MWYQRKIFPVIFMVVVLFSIWTLLPNWSRDQSNVDIGKLDYTKWMLAKWTGQISSACVNQCDRVFRDIFKRLTVGYRHCLIEQLENKSAFPNLGPAVSSCLGDALWRLIDVKTLQNRDDTKQAILPPIDAPAIGPFSECTEITLGIGRDIEAELLLRRAQPHCKFYGADPIKTSGDIFRELGPYFELAVDSRAGKMRANVLEGDKYKEKTVKAVTFVDFLLNYVNVTKVDYLLMDNEGPEYRLFPQLLTGGIIESRGISLCQISVEMHQPFENYGVNEQIYTDLIHSILTNSSYLPIWSTSSSHIRSFYVNVGDPYCVGKYFRSKWCGDYEYYKEKEDH